MLRNRAKILMSLGCVVIASQLGILVGCNDDTSDSDRMDATRLFVRNQTGVELRINSEPQSSSDFVGAGEIAYIASVAGATSWPNEILSSMTIVDLTGETVYVHQNPIQNEAWSLELDSEVMRDFFFVVSDSMLVVGDAAPCGQPRR